MIRTRGEAISNLPLPRVPPVFASCRPVLPFRSSVPSTRTSGTVATVFESARQIVGDDRQPPARVVDRVTGHDRHGRHCSNAG